MLRPMSAPVLLTTDALIAIDKPFDVPVQGGSGVKEGGSIDAQYPDCRLVHRLDRDTTGVLVLARTKKAAARLTAGFSDRDAQKIYLALVAPAPALDRDQGMIEAPILKGKDRCYIDSRGLPAQTYFKVMARNAENSAALVRFEPLTGRTHQIRVHAQHAGFPLLGDPRYGDFAASRALLSGGAARRMYLHAWRLDIADPMGKNRLEITAPLPTDWPFEALALPRPSA